MIGSVFMSNVGLVAQVMYSASLSIRNTPKTVGLQGILLVSAVMVVLDVYGVVMDMYWLLIHHGGCPISEDNI